MSASRIDPSACRIDEPHEGPTAAERHGAQARDLLFAHLPDAPALDRKVVSGAADHSTTYLAESTHDGVGGDLVAAAHEAHGAAEHTDLEEHAVVEESREPLARRELSALVLLFDLRRATHRAHLFAACFEILYEFVHVHRLSPIFGRGALRGIEPQRPKGPKETPGPRLQNAEADCQKPQPTKIFG